MGRSRPISFLKIQYVTVKEEEEREKAGGESERPFIVFSAKFTLLNILLHIIGNVAFGLSVAHITQRSLYLGPYITEWEVAPLFGIPVYLVVRVKRNAIGATNVCVQSARKTLLSLT